MIQSLLSHGGTLSHSEATRRVRRWLWRASEFAGGLGEPGRWRMAWVCLRVRRGYFSHSDAMGELLGIPKPGGGGEMAWECLKCCGWRGGVSNVRAGVGVPQSSPQHPGEAPAPKAPKREPAQSRDPASIPAPAQSREPAPPPSQPKQPPTPSPAPAPAKPWPPRSPVPRPWRPRAPRSPNPGC